MDPAQRSLGRALIVIVVAGAAFVACGDGEREDAPTTEGPSDSEPSLTEPCEDATLPYASELVRFGPGEGAGFGQRNLPQVVLGPPDAVGPERGSLDVVSLGAGGELVVGFGERELVDGEGPDLLVFENAFYVAGGGGEGWMELGEVAVSDDGQTWHAWPCDAQVSGPPWSGCAGWTPTLAFSRCSVTALEPEVTGGDAFDLADLGVASARYVRVRDLSAKGAAPSVGFDLDAVGLIHWREQAPE